MADLTVIDPDGVVIITVGKPGFQVSSKVLSLAPPVFKALFGPKFAEGQFVIDNARLIELQDDDPETLDIMCRLFHHEPAPPSPIGIERLEKMAIIADKFDCVRAMHYWAKLEIMAVRQNTKEPCRLLWPALRLRRSSIFQQPDQFSGVAPTVRTFRRISSLIQDLLRVLSHVAGAMTQALLPEYVSQYCLVSAKSNADSEISVEPWSRWIVLHRNISYQRKLRAISLTG